MHVSRLELTDFRNYRSAAVELTEGVTAILGDNGQGKTNLVEALGWLASMHSFRGVPDDALVRVGADAAVLRADIDNDGRALLVEAEIPRRGRNRVLVNKQRLPRARELLGVLRTTVFSPDDLTLVKGSPGERRTFLDDLIVALRPRDDVLLTELDRVLRQRNTLLKQANGRLSPEIAFTLDVWDSKLASVADTLGAARAATVARLAPHVESAHDRLAGAHARVALAYEPAWRGVGMAAALVAARADDVKRGVTTVGPHRDEIDVILNGSPARTHASQGEQRTIALSLRLAGHELVTDAVGSPPVLLLDDVFSELDASRTKALVANVPKGQVVITSAVVLPDGVDADRVVRISAGAVESS